MNKRVSLAMLLVFSMASVFVGCKSWAPVSTEQGNCAVDRQWVAPQQDPKTGEWKEGYCEWLPGKSG